MPNPFDEVDVLDREASTATAENPFNAIDSIPFEADRDESPDPTLPQYLNFKINTDKADAERSRYGSEAMWGKMETTEALQKGNEARDYWKAQAGPYEDLSFKKHPFKYVAGETVQLLPYMLSSQKEGLKNGLILGGGFAAVTAVAGQAGPQIALPEEIYTVPSSFAAGMQTGYVYGIIKNVIDREGGGTYLDMVERGISPETSRKLALAGGTLNGVIEVAQFKLLGKPFKQAFSKVINTKVGKAAITAAVGRYIKTVGGEVGQEEAQEITSLVVETLAGAIDEKPDAIPTKEEWKTRLIETAMKAGTGLAVISMPGAAVDVKTSMRKEKISIRPEEAEVLNKVVADIKAEQAGEVKPAQEAKPGASKQGEIEAKQPLPATIEEESVSREVKAKELSPEQAKIETAKKDVELKGRANKLIDEQKTKAVQVEELNKTIEGYKKEGKDTLKLEVKREGLYKEYDALENQISDILTGDVENILGREKIMMSASEIGRLTKEVAILSAKESKAQEKLLNEKIGIIKQQLVDYVKDKLDVEERGKFITSVKNIKTEKQLAEQLARVDEIEKQAEKRRLVSEIKKSAGRVLDSNSVAIEYTDMVNSLLEDIDLQKVSKATKSRVESAKKYIRSQAEKGEPVEMPEALLKKIERLEKKNIKDLSVEDLGELLENIENLAVAGETKLRLRTEKYEREKLQALERIKKESKPLVEREALKADIGTRLSAMEEAKNKWRETLNILNRKHLAITPNDVLFDMLDGSKNYKGANYETFKKPIDRAYSKYLDLKDSVENPVVELAKKLKLDETNFDRIGVYAAREQEGGVDKLLNSGYTLEQIGSVELNAAEMKLYEAMRAKLDYLKPMIDEVMRLTYNQKIGTVKNYFSFMTDFDGMSDFEIRERFSKGIPELNYATIRKNVEKGFTKQRTLGKQKIKVNAMDVYLRHIDNATYLIEVGSITKRLGEIAATKEYGEAVGDLGQEVVREWVDLQARKGKTQGDRILLVDTLRKHAGAAVLGFKLSSALIQPTALLDGAALIGNYAFKGAYDMSTNREWRVFLKENFPELRDRIGDDPAYLEFQEGRKLRNKAERLGFWPLQKLDMLTASSITVGAYEKYMAEHGLEVDFTKPNQDAIDYAQHILRRTQSSARFKDLPSAFTQGKLTGNKAIDRAVLQFQSFMLNRWSLIEHDMVRAGIKKGNAAQAANIFMYLSLATLAETSIRHLSKELIARITGDDLDDWSETFTEEFVNNTLQNIPVVSQIVSTWNYGNMPVPSISVVQDALNKIQIWKRTKDPDKRATNRMIALMTLFGVSMGIPGTLQITDILKKWLKNDTELEIK